MKHFGVQVDFLSLSLEVRRKISSCYKAGNLTGYYPIDSDCKSLEHLLGLVDNPNINATDLLVSYYQYLRQ